MKIKIFFSSFEKLKKKFFKKLKKSFKNVPKMSLKNEKKMKKKFFKSCCCCYQTAKTRTVCVCNLKINRLRKKVLKVSGN